MASNAAAERPEQFVADAARGELVAVKLCSSCHIVRPDQTRGVVAGVPSFRAMTKLPRPRINRQLITPHAPMPNMQLTLKEIADILAFVEALRREAAGEPEIAPDSSQKTHLPIAIVAALTNRAALIIEPEAEELEVGRDQDS